jgi:hypothetical protein
MKALWSLPQINHSAVGIDLTTLLPYLEEKFKLWLGKDPVSMTVKAPWRKSNSCSHQSPGPAAIFRQTVGVTTLHTKKSADDQTSIDELILV